MLGLRVEVLYSRHALIFPKSGNFRKVTSVIRQTSTTQLNPRAAAALLCASLCDDSQWITATVGVQRLQLLQRRRFAADTFGGRAERCEDRTRRGGTVCGAAVKGRA